MDLQDILLWTFSLLISSVSLTFAFLATYFSNKSNKIIKNFIEKTWMYQEARSIFMIQLKKVERENSKSIEVLKKIPYWNKYFLSLTNTRLLPISQIAQSFLKPTKYEPVLKEYKKSKALLDSKFAALVDFRNLNDLNRKLINKNKVVELIEYHLIVKGLIRRIITLYTKITVEDN